MSCFYVCCYTQNLLGNKVNCITKFQGTVSNDLMYSVLCFAHINKIQIIIDDNKLISIMKAFH